jgi:3-hydroxybutyrate dehydrogenase/3-oxoacyl-[acyl-carrier protein] reductase
MSLTNLQHKVALVTGGASGTGLEVARRLAGAGAHVVITSRDRVRSLDAVQSLQSEGGRASAVPLDLMDSSSVDKMMSTILAEHAGLDIVVANSGVGGPSRPIWEVEPESLLETLQVNVVGTFLTVARSIEHFVATGRRGRIVVIGSMTGKRPLAHRSAYATSKAALIGLVRTAALDAGEHGIRINLVSPGFIDGGRLDWVIEEQAKALGRHVDQARQELAALAPLRRFVDAGNVAGAVEFLVSDASDGITGVDLNVSAGLVMY